MSAAAHTISTSRSFGGSPPPKLLAHARHICAVILDLVGAMRCKAIEHELFSKSELDELHRTSYSSTSRIPRPC